MGWKRNKVKKWEGDKGIGKWKKRREGHALICRGQRKEGGKTIRWRNNRGRTAIREKGGEKIKV